MAEVITGKQDLTYLKWSHIRKSSGTAGSFLKSQSELSGQKLYYKLSNYDSEKGIIGHECINEIIADRLLEILDVEHLSYQLIHADIMIDGKVHETWLCASGDFKEKGESKASLDDFYQTNQKGNESHYEFCRRMGWQDYIDTMIAFDYLILNRDRHGANIEVLRNARRKTVRLAPLFDHGLSLLCRCMSEEEIRKFDVTDDKMCNNFIGGRSTLENLDLTVRSGNRFRGSLKHGDKGILFRDISGILSKEHEDKIWDMIWTRWCHYEDICHNR